MTNAIISSTKYDGSLHYRYDTTLVRAEGNEISFYTPPHVEMTTYRGELKTKSHLLQIFFTDRPWNVVVRWHADWRFEEHYVNIAEPATWDGRVLNWVDLDLDIINRPTMPEPKLDDEDEFERHRVKWSYPQGLVDRAWGAVEEVWGMIKRADCPFDEATTLWRPGAGTSVT